MMNKLRHRLRKLPCGIAANSRARIPVHVVWFESALQ